MNENDNVRIAYVGGAGKSNSILSTLDALKTQGFSVENVPAPGWEPTEHYLVPLKNTPGEMTTRFLSLKKQASEYTTKGDSVTEEIAKEEELVHPKVLAATLGFIFTPSEAIEGISCKAMTAEDITEEHIAITKKMLTFLTKSGVYGIAAPQFGMNERFFAMYDKKNSPIVAYNPKYFRDGSTGKYLESCLSYGEKKYVVERFKGIRVSYEIFDPESNSMVHMVGKLNSLEAQIFQHETDHLNGKTVSTRQLKPKKAKVRRG
jgi:peptide deformylase